MRTKIVLSQKLIEQVYIALRLEEIAVQEMGCTLSREVQEALDAMREADDGSLDLAYLLRVTEPEPKPPPPLPCDPPENKYQLGHRVYSKLTMNLGTENVPITIEAGKTNGTIVRLPKCAGRPYGVQWHKRTMQVGCDMFEDEMILAPAALQPAHVKPTL
jgi:hypothetical protein